MSGSESAPAHSSGESETEDQAGILGNLPRSRPAVRSPRRADPPADPSPAAEGGDGGVREPAPREGREAEIEALAKAGVSLAGSAATLGLRAAGRAAAALRDAVERR